MDLDNYGLDFEILIFCPPLMSDVINVIEIVFFNW